ncbi:MAG: fumarylacetoacetate hydrolase family protein [Phycisphaerae bacterium]|nr:fumarylacetoacetate hydrolase family protein [Phycisphaerae bacterium]
MQILRFVDTTGVVRWGKPVDERRALPMIGELFGDRHFASEPVDVARRLAPVAPPNILAIGRNYRDHAKEMKATDAPSEPLVFLKATTAVIGPDDAVILPRSAPDEVDFEAELAVVIGKTAKNVSEASALDHVFGYTCANDVTARDCQQRRDKQWARAKSFDSFCPLGPVLVTRDDFNPDAVGVRSVLNGRVMQDGNTGDMIFSVPALVSYLSHQFTLLAGTVILTGTPSGVGVARQPQVFLRPGDEISVQIDGLGCLTNRVVCVYDHEEEEDTR